MLQTSMGATHRMVVKKEKERRAGPYVVVVETKRDITDCDG